MNTIETLKEKIVKYNPGADLEVIDKAYRYAREMHGDQKRVSGEPYITHPLEVAHILADMQLDCDAIAAGLLHDVIEDTKIDDFNKKVFHLNKQTFILGLFSIDLASLLYIFELLK